MAALSLSLRDRQTLNELARLGDLSWMLDDHQDARMYGHYRAWNDNKHKDEGDGAHRIWMLDAARQTGKSFCTGLIRVEDCILAKPNARFISAAATEVSLKEYIIPNIDSIIAELPSDIKPRFVTRHLGMRAAYIFPHNNAVLKLVGIDEDIDGLRGPKCDGATIHEAAFVRKLKEVVGAIIYPQFQRGSDASLILESSAPKDPAHSYDTVFKPSCERRKAYVFMTIDDNTALSEKTKRSYVAAAEEIDPNDAKREYYGERVRDKTQTVFPDAGKHLKIKDYELPARGLAMTTLDPGQVHFFAASFSIYDFERAQVVFIDDWAESNPNTRRVAAVVAAREYDLFGTPPNPMLAEIPLDDEYDRSGKLRVSGWRSLLAGDRCEALAETLYNLAQGASGDELSTFQWFDAANGCWRGNPHVRFSDTELQVINDLTNIYGLDVAPTTKESLPAMVGNGRARMSQGRVAFALYAAEPQGANKAANTYDAVHTAQWNTQHTKFAEHPEFRLKFGHFDLAACYTYAMRNWPDYWNYSVDPPAHIGKGGDSWVGDVVEENYEAEEDDWFGE